MAEDLNSLLQKFNELDMDPASTENFILGLEQAKSGVKSYTKKEAEELNLGTLTKKDIEELRAAREAEVALKRGLITASQAKTSKKTKQIAKVGKLHSGLGNLVKKQKQELTDLEKLKQEFQPQAQVIKKSAKKNVLPKTKSGIESLGKQLSSFNTGDTIPNISNNLPKQYAFEQDFLVSTRGLINKDELLRLLISTWEEKMKVHEDISKDIKERGSSESGSLLGVLPLLGLLFKKLWKGLISIGSQLAKMGKYLFKKAGFLLSKLKKALIDPIIKSIKNLWGKVKKISSNLWKNTKDAVKKSWDSVKKFAKDNYNKVKSKIGEYIKNIKEGFKSLKSKVKSFWDRFKNSNFVQKIKDGFKNLIKTISNWIREGIKNGINWLKNKFGWGKKIKPKKPKTPSNGKGSKKTKAGIEKSPKKAKPKTKKVKTLKTKSGIEKSSKKLKSAKKPKSVKKPNWLKKTGKWWKSAKQVFKPIGKALGAAGSVMVIADSASTGKEILEDSSVVDQRTEDLKEAWKTLLTSSNYKTDARNAFSNFKQGKGSFKDFMVIMGMPPNIKEKALATLEALNPVDYAVAGGGYIGEKLGDLTFGKPQPYTNTTTASIPSELANPNYRTREIQPAVTPINLNIQTFKTPINFKEDGDSTPMPGMSYIRGY